MKTKTPATDPQLINDLFTALNVKRTSIARNDDNRVFQRLRYLGLTTQCSRCSGSGEFGPRSVHGGTCFKCGGMMSVMPKITRQLVETAKAKVDAGELVPYFEEIRLKRIATTARENAMNIWSSTKISKMYDWSKATREAYHREISDQNKQMSIRYDRIDKLTYRNATSESGTEVQALLTEMEQFAIVMLENCREIQSRYTDEEMGNVLRA